MLGLNSLDMFAIAGIRRIESGQQLRSNLLEKRAGEADNHAFDQRDRQMGRHQQDRNSGPILFAATDEYETGQQRCQEHCEGANNKAADEDHPQVQAAHQEA